MLFEDQHAAVAELRDGPGRRETAHSRADHDDVGFLNVSHVRSLLNKGGEIDLTFTEWNRAGVVQCTVATSPGIDRPVRTAARWITGPLASWTSAAARTSGWPWTR
ncbi:hypothetical protein Abr02nite_59140 [Paractinoplanes brasiliensis]|nr:hypothetical protein Abr02nite_59140 [Actinoplanes brasiliensis]